MLGVERNVLAETVNRIDKSQLMCKHKPRNCDLVDILVRPTAELRWNGMSGQPTCLNANAAQFAELSRCPQHFQFGFNRQAVSGFYLDSRNTFGDERIQPRQGLLHQIILRGFTGGLHCRKDAPAPPGNFRIVNPVKPQFELPCPVARKHDVCVTVHQSRRNQGASKVHGRTATHSGRQFGPGTDPCDQFALNNDRAVIHEPIRATTDLHGCSIAIVQHGFGHGSISPMPVHLLGITVDERASKSMPGCVRRRQKS